MANPNPDASRARRTKRSTRRPKPGTIKQLTAVLWNAITKLEEAIEPPMIDGTLELDEQHKQFSVQVGELTRLAHALSQAGGVYLKAIEVGELQAQIDELRKQVEARG